MRHKTPFFTFVRHTTPFFTNNLSDDYVPHLSPLVSTVPLRIPEEEMETPANLGRTSELLKIIQDGKVVGLRLAPVQLPLVGSV